MANGGASINSGFGAIDSGTLDSSLPSAPDGPVPTTPKEPISGKLDGLISDVLSEIPFNIPNKPDFRQSLLDNFYEKVYESEVGGICIGFARAFE